MKEKEKEEKNKEYLSSLLTKNETVSKQSTPVKKSTNVDFEQDSIDYSNISLNILPAGRFYKYGTKIAIRAAKVTEIQSYSMVDDNNFVDITDKMNELLARNIIFTHPNGSKGSYKDIKDSDRVYLIFMIRELTFQGGNTLTKEVTCSSDTCDKEFFIPFRSTPGPDAPTTFELHEPNSKIERFFNKDTQTYQIIHNEISWNLSPPTIGIQEDFYEEIKRNVQADKKPDIVFMKIMPFLLTDMNSITEEELKTKSKEFKAATANDLILSQGLNEIINNMTVGIKGLKMKCPECGTEVHTPLTFPGGASTLFELPNILDRFGK